MSLEQPIADLLQKQLTLERQNAAFYRAYAFALDNDAWPGSSRFFLASSNEEQEHADKLASFLVDRGYKPAYDAVEEVETNPDSLPLSAFEEALAAEIRTTDAIESMYLKADPQTQAFLNWFLEEQTKSVKEVKDIVLELQRADDSAAALILDERYGELK